MKKLNVLTKLFLLVALLVGSVSAWGADEVYKTALFGSNYNSGGISDYTSSWSATNNGFTVNISNFNNNNNGWSYIKCGRKNNASTAAIITKYAIDEAVTKVDVTIDAITTDKITSITLYTSSDNSTWTSAGTYTKATGVKSVSLASPTANLYYKIEFVCASGSSNGLCQISKVEYYKTKVSAFTLSAVSNNDSYGTVSVEDDVITASPNTGYQYASPAYTITEGEANVTSVEQEGDEFTVTATGDCTVTINFEAIPTYTVSFNAQAGTCATTSLTETLGGAGVTLPTATITLDGWTFAGWATAATANTTTRPTLYKAGNTYYPEDDITLYAVYTLEGVDYEKYERATSLEQITSASSIALVNSSKILNKGLLSTNAPTETGGKINEPTATQIWTLSGNNTDGYTLTNAGETLGTTTETFSSSDSYVVSLSSNNNKWQFVTATSGTNMFVLRNKNLNSNNKVGSLQYYSNQSKWQAYFLASSTFAGNGNVQSKIYVPVATAYNSNPTQAVITPTVAFTNSTTKTLYLDGTTSYTNAATVTGVDKTITYTSSDESVATVNASGVVTAVGIGTATITASVAAELGVNKEASDTYDVVVKNTTTIAGLKALYNSAQSTAKAFSADLTNAIVTYVNGSHAYIQDASGAIYASCGSSLTAGKKINGAVSGTITAPNQIDEIKTIDISTAIVTDTEVPAPEVKTLAQIKAGDYEGKLVTVNAATVKTGMKNATSGGVITDDADVTTFNIIAPNNLTLNATEVGNFTGFVSIYNGTTYRLNIYEAGQYVKTRNVNTEQPLEFTEDAVELDEETSAFAAFTGQIVSGAQGTVTYAITGDAIGTVNAETGIVTLNGTCGTATITATAAAKEVTDAGVTTPYTETEESYTVTVRPRYTVTFNVNGLKTVVREASYGAGVAVPDVDDYADYVFRGWNTTTVDPTDTKPAGLATLDATIYPEANTEYYAVFADENISGSGGNYTLDYANESDIYNQDIAYATETNLTASDGSAWVIHAYSQKNNTYGLQINTGKSASIKVPSCPSNITTINVTCKTGAIKGVGFSATANGSSVISVNDGVTQTLDLTGKDMKDGYIIPVNGNAIITNIVVNYGPTITYSDYRTSLPSVAVSIGSSELASFCYDRALDFTDTDVTAYTAKVDVEGNVVLTKVTDGVLPANEGIILFGSEGEYEIPVTAADPTFDFSDNEMEGVLVRTQILWESDGKHNYILQQGEFNKATDGYLKPNRAYLHTTFDVSASPANKMTIIFNDSETDGIRSIENGKLNIETSAYNLSGQRVGNDYKGFVIINGKKVIRK